MSKDPSSAGVEVNKSKPPFRPDLSQSKSPDLNSERILSTLGSPGGKGSNYTERSKSPSALMVVILFALVAAGTAYWYLTSQSNPLLRSINIAKINAEKISTGTPVVAAVPAALSVPDTPKSDLAGLGQTPTLQPAVTIVKPAAQIINEPRAPVITAKTTETKLTDALEKDIKPPKAAIQNALNSKPNTSKTNSKTDAIQVAKSAAKLRNVSQTAAGDKDISLIAALLAHNSSSQANTRLAPARAGTPDAQTKSVSTSPVVNPSVATAGLDLKGSALKRCDGLGLLQFEVCKFKACDKQWETDASCKATLSQAR